METWKRFSTQTTPREGLLSIAALLMALLLPACAQLPQTLQGDALEERLRIPEKCKLMGQADPNTECEVVRQALVGATLTEGDRLALACFDNLHAKKLNEAKKSFNSGIAKAPANPHLLACGKVISSLEKK